MLRLVSFFFVLVVSFSAQAVEYYWTFPDGSGNYPSPSAACVDISAAANPPPDHTFSYTGFTFQGPQAATCDCDLIDPFGNVNPGANCGNTMRFGTECPEGKEYNETTGSCQLICTPGSLASHCAVDCPALEYTYYNQGILRRGRIGYGKVGHGQSCPQPSFPPGSDTGCIGTPGTCTDYPEGINEGEDVTKTDTTKTTDGDTTTTEETTTTSPGTDSTPEGGGGGGGGTPVDSSGQEVEVGTEGVSEETVDLGAETYALCDHGGVVSGEIGCDYNPPQCSVGQVATEFGCLDKPEADPEESPPTKTTTETVDPQTGDTTTTTVETEGTSGGGSAQGQEEGEQEEKTFAGGQTCGAPPTCSGDPIQCGLAQQQWRTRCVEQSEIDQKISDIQSEIAGDSRFNNIWDSAEEIDLSSDLGTSPGGFLSSSCPSDISINTSVVNFTVPLTPFCDLAGFLRPLVIAMAWLMAVRIVGRAI